MTGMTPERLAEIRGRVTWATEGPWAPWPDQDGQPHMHGLLMVGNADAVIPEGEAWVEDVDVNPIAHTYTPEDRRFIAHARADVPDLLDEVDRLRSIVAGVEALHVKHEQVLCGAMAEVPHRHSSEPRREPYPIRPVVCTQEEGHEGPHKDALCCWNFQEFTEHAAYKSHEWADRSSCSHCRAEWPCPTVDLLNPTEGETSHE